jgi:DNA-binding transcriptional regulator YiaG
MYTFRNVCADPSDPVSSWPYEALVAAIERGGVTDWARITSQIAREPWGEVARQVEDYLGYASPYGVAPLLQRAVQRARAQAAQQERLQVAQQVASLVEQSGLTREQFARRVGTSRTRLSTYISGTVTPSAALLARMHNLVHRMTPADPLRLTETGRGNTGKIEAPREKTRTASAQPRQE